MYWRLETLLIEIFQNFLFYLALGTTQSVPDQNVKVIFKKFNHPAKFTFLSQSEALQYEAFYAATFGSLTAEPIVIEKIRNPIPNPYHKSSPMSYVDSTCCKY